MKAPKLLPSATWPPGIPLCGLRRFQSVANDLKENLCQSHVVVQSIANMQKLANILDRISITLSSIIYLVLRKAGLSRRSPYKVMLRGEPLWWIGEDGNPEEIGGFYTTRWVLALSQQEATVRAVRAVRKETDKFAHNPVSSPIRIEIENCFRIDGYVTSRGRGFAFWPKQGDPSRREIVN